MSDDANSAGAYETLFTSGAILVIGLLFKQFFGFGGRLIIARFLGKVDYGAVALGFTLASTATILIVLGLDNGIGRYLPRYDDQQKRRGVLTSAFQLVLPLSLLAGVTVAFFAEPIARHAFTDPDVAPVIRVFAVTIPLAAFVRLTIGSIRGLKQSLPRVYIEHLTLPTSRFTLIAVAVWLGLGTTGVAWAYAGAYALAVALSIYYLARYTPLLDDTRPEPMYRDLLVFSAPLMVTATMVVVFANLDTFMLGYFATTGDVGVYNVVYPLARLLQIALVAFNFLLMPIVSELHSAGKMGEIRRMYLVVSKWIAFVTLPAFLSFVFFPDLLIRWTFGPEYVAGGLALSVLASGFYINAIAGPGGNVLMALGNSRLIMYVNVLLVAVNAALNVYLIPRYSILGAAVATVVGYACMNGLFILFLHRDIGTHPIRWALVRPVTVAAGIWLVLTWLVRVQLGTSLPTYLGLLLVFLPLYGTILVRFGGIEQEELRLLDTLEDRFDIRLDRIRRIARQLAS